MSDHAVVDRVPADWLVCRSGESGKWHLMESENISICGRTPAIGYFDEDAPFDGVARGDVCKRCLAEVAKHRDLWIPPPREAAQL